MEFDNYKDNLAKLIEWNNQYTDYTFLNPNRIMIIEAKREGGFFNCP